MVEAVDEVDEEQDVLHGECRDTTFAVSTNDTDRSHDSASRNDRLRRGDHRLVFAAPAFANADVQITKAGFDPPALTIAAGESVNWVDRDTVDHTLVSAAAKGRVGVSINSKSTGACLATGVSNVVSIQAGSAAQAGRAPTGDELRSGMPQRDEESLIDDMRATIRADRARAAARAPKPAESPPPDAPAAVEPAKNRLRRLLGRSPQGRR